MYTFIQKMNLDTKFTPFTKLNSKRTINLLLDDLEGWDVGVGGSFKREGVYVYI